ncbi:MAG: nucleotide exchange factor GrpE [Planctomycetes bacterium]|nr:nucleotide exchange factor GrpE [Planctomycetota bacterium]MCL4730186.1 nucleotide exchange factor GrpE [Planctomycetota bacterium]
MAKKHEIEPEGPQTESHAAEQALGDQQAAQTAEKARHGEEIAQAQDTPASKAARLRELSDDELLALAEEAARADHWLAVARRAQADLENTIKRLRRDQEEAVRYACAPLARDLLPVLDNLTRALGAAQSAKDFDGLYKGLELVARLFADALARHEIRPIEAAGRPFDPATHDAVMTASNPDLDDNVVAQEFERGWTLHDRVLRAAKVSVNKKA